MKIRAGFVSNSSSSSYIILAEKGKLKQFDQLKKLDVVKDMAKRFCRDIKKQPTEKDIRYEIGILLREHLWTIMDIYSDMTRQGHVADENQNIYDLIDYIFPEGDEKYRFYEYTKSLNDLGEEFLKAMPNKPRKLVYTYRAFKKFERKASLIYQQEAEGLITWMIEGIKKRNLDIRLLEYGDVYKQKELTYDMEEQFMPFISKYPLEDVLVLTSNNH